jgi:ubiquinone biosynthesis protein
MIQPLRALRAYRRLSRYRQVAFVLAKYGFGDIVNRLGLASLRGRLTGTAGLAESPTPVRVRMALVDLGPTFVKFGQLLSTRPDILPERYIQEFSRLQDEVPPFPSEQVRQIIHDDLGKSPEELFEQFEPSAVASGSIAQVHRAVGRDGSNVAVKVQRPGVRRIIEADLGMLNDFATLVEKHIPELSWLQPTRLVEQFARTIRRELDFVAEGQAIERFRRNFRDDPTHYVPAVHWESTSERVLTTDWVDGVKVTDLKGLEERGFDRRVVARNGARIILKEVFEDQIFHADPHPGNFFVTNGNAIAAVDFGIIGRLDDETAEQLGTLLISILRRDAEGVVGVFSALGLLGRDVDLALLRFDIMEFIDRYYGLPLNRINLEAVISDLLQMVRRHHIILPMNLALLGRMLAVASGVGRMLDPEFNIVEEARPFIQRLLARRLDPRRSARRLFRTWKDYQAMFRRLPGDVEEIAAKLKKGQMLVALHHKGLARFILEMDRSSNRLAFAMIVAALIIGSSLIIRLERGPALFGFPALGLVGFLIAGILGLWLVVAILRSGRI